LPLHLVREPNSDGPGYFWSGPFPSGLSRLAQLKRRTRVDMNETA